jgi:hypothetical protein
MHAAVDGDAGPQHESLAVDLAVSYAITDREGGNAVADHHISRDLVYRNRP